VEIISEDVTSWAESSKKLRKRPARRIEEAENH
jgi:hypothetical protein